MSPELLKLIEFRKEHPFVSYFIIAILIISVILGIVTASKGLWIPLLVGVLLLVFFALLLIVFSRTATARNATSIPILGTILLWFVAIIFMIWIVLLTLAMLGRICLPFISKECIQKPLYEVSGNISPIYKIKKTTTTSKSHRHYRSSCSGRSRDIFRVCLPVGYQATSGVVQGLWVKNNNGSTGTPKLDPNNNRCYVVDWNAASGGRTAFGECRYHADIKFSLDVSGVLMEGLNGKREVFHKALNTFTIEEFSYPATIPQNVVDTNWKYSITVKKPDQWFGLVKGWNETASSDVPETKCLKTMISDGNLRLENLCH